MKHGEARICIDASLGESAESGKPANMGES